MPSFLSKVFGRKKEKAQDEKEKERIVHSGSPSPLGGKFEEVRMTPTLRSLPQGRNSSSSKSSASLPRRSSVDPPHLSLNLSSSKEDRHRALGLVFERDASLQVVLPDSVINQRRLSPSETQLLIKACSQAIVARGLDTLGLMHPHWHAASPDIQRKLISLFLNSLSSSSSSSPSPSSALSPSPLTSRFTDTHALSEFNSELGFTRTPQDVAAVLRWGLRHLELETNQFGRSPTWYRDFYTAEASSSYPPKAFSSIIPPLVPDSHHKLLIALLELVNYVAAHAEANGISGSKFSKVVGLWLLNGQRTSAPSDDWSSFYARWESAGRQLEHLFLASIRDENANRPVPRRLSELVLKYPYSTDTNTDGEALLPRPRFTTRAYNALLLRIETTLPGYKSTKQHPFDIISEALSCAVPLPPDDENLPAPWKVVQDMPGQGELRVLSDETIRILSLVPYPDRPLSPTFTSDLTSSSLASSAWTSIAPPHKRSASAAESVATPTSQIVTNGVHHARSSTSPIQPTTGHTLGWSEFQQTGFMESAPIPLASTLMDKDIEVTQPPVTIKRSMSRKSTASTVKNHKSQAQDTTPPLPSAAATISSSASNNNNASASVPASSVDTESKEKPKVWSTFRSLTHVKLDEAFIDFWHDAFIDPVSSSWPNFILIKLKHSVVAQIEVKCGSKIEWVIIEQSFAKPPPAAPKVLPTVTPLVIPSLSQQSSIGAATTSGASASATSPASPTTAGISSTGVGLRPAKDKDATSAKKRFSNFFRSTSGRGTKRPGQSPKTPVNPTAVATIGEMGEILESAHEPPVQPAPDSLKEEKEKKVEEEEEKKKAQEETVKGSAAENKVETTAQLDFPPLPPSTPSLALAEEDAKDEKEPSKAPTPPLPEAPEPDATERTQPPLSEPAAEEAEVPTPQTLPEPPTSVAAEVKEEEEKEKPTQIPFPPKPITEEVKEKTEEAEPALTPASPSPSSPGHHERTEDITAQFPPVPTVSSPQPTEEKDVKEVLKEEKPAQLLPTPLQPSTHVEEDGEKKESNERIVDVPDAQLPPSSDMPKDLREVEQIEDRGLVAAAGAAALGLAVGAAVPVAVASEDSEDAAKITMGASPSPPTLLAITQDEDAKPPPKFEEAKTDVEIPSMGSIDETSQAVAVDGPRTESNVESETPVVEEPMAEEVGAEPGASEDAAVAVVSTVKPLMSLEQDTSLSPQQPEVEEAGSGSMETETPNQEIAATAKSTPIVEPPQPTAFVPSTQETVPLGEAAGSLASDTIVTNLTSDVAVAPDVEASTNLEDDTAPLAESKSEEAEPLSSIPLPSATEDDAVAVEDPEKLGGVGQQLDSAPIAEVPAVSVPVEVAVSEDQPPSKTSLLTSLGPTISEDQETHAHEAASPSAYEEFTTLEIPSLNPHSAEEILAPVNNSEAPAVEPASTAKVMSSKPEEVNEVIEHDEPQEPSPIAPAAEKAQTIEADVIDTTIQGGSLIAAGTIEELAPSTESNMTIPSGHSAESSADRESNVHPVQDKLSRVDSANPQEPTAQSNPLSVPAALPESQELAFVESQTSHDTTTDENPPTSIEPATLAMDAAPSVSDSATRSVEVHTSIENAKQSAVLDVLGTCVDSGFELSEAVPTTASITNEPTSNGQITLMTQDNPPSDTSTSNPLIEDITASSSPETEPLSREMLSPDHDDALSQEAPSVAVDSGSKISSRSTTPSPEASETEVPVTINIAPASPQVPESELGSRTDEMETSRTDDAPSVEHAPEMSGSDNISFEVEGTKEISMPSIEVPLGHPPPSISEAAELGADEHVMNPSVTEESSASETEPVIIEPATHTVVDPPASHTSLGEAKTDLPIEPPAQQDEDLPAKTEPSGTSEEKTTVADIITETVDPLASHTEPTHPEMPTLLTEPPLPSEPAQVLPVTEGTSKNDTLSHEGGQVSTNGTEPIESFSDPSKSEVKPGAMSSGEIFSSSTTEESTTSTSVPAFETSTELTHSSSTPIETKTDQDVVGNPSEATSSIEESPKLDEAEKLPANLYSSFEGASTSGMDDALSKTTKIGDEDGPDSACAAVEENAGRLIDSCSNELEAPTLSLEPHANMESDVEVLVFDDPSVDDQAVKAQAVQLARVDAPPVADNITSIEAVAEDKSSP